MSTTITHIEKKNSITPKLRFKEFREKWEINKIGDISTVSAGGTPSTLKKEFWGGKIRWMNSGELNLKIVKEVENRITEEGLKNSSTKLIPIKCILIGLAGQGKTRGTAAINLVELCVNQSIAAIFPNQDKFIPEYLYQNIDFRYEELRNLSTGGGGRGGLNLQIIKSFEVPIPTLPEQQKIASFLSAIDEKIEQLTCKKELLEQYKKGVMQQLFSGKLRFKDDKGNAFPKWELKRLGEITIDVKRDLKDKSDFSDLEVLTISSEKGFISQKERFSQVIAGESLSKYTLLEKGGMSYNRGASKRFRYGCFFLLDNLERALVPNVYISFEFKTTCMPDFFSQLFSTGYANNQLKKFISSSVRLDGLLNINREDFFSILIKVPSLIEQKKISNYLSNIDTKIGSVTKQISQTQTFKKGLLQQIFV